MTVELQPADVRGADREAVVAVLTGNEWPFHVRRRPIVATVTAAIDTGAFDDDYYATFWLVEDGARVGIAVLEDLTDDTRCSTCGSPQQPAAAAGAWRPCGHSPSTSSPPGRRHREAWPVDGGPPVASIGYGADPTS